jgi:hypothetical protein
MVHIPEGLNLFKLNSPKILKFYTVLIKKYHNYQKIKPEFFPNSSYKNWEFSYRHYYIIKSRLIRFQCMERKECVCVCVVRVCFYVHMSVKISYLNTDLDIRIEHILKLLRCHLRNTVHHIKESSAHSIIRLGTAC